MKAVELFCGAGGSALGLLDAGISSIEAFDNELLALEVIARNRDFFIGRGCSILPSNRDLISRPYDSEAEVSLLVAGPPCQPFSLSGKRRGFVDSRDGLRAVANSIEKVTPATFLIENVDGIRNTMFRGQLHNLLERVAGKRGRMLKPLDINSGEIDFEGDAYKVFTNILNAADYGIPQFRRRWFAVGVKRDRLEGRFKWPKPTHSKLALRASKVSGEYWDEHQIVRRPLLADDQDDQRNFFANCLRWRTCRDVILEFGVPRRNHGVSTFGHFHRSGARAYRGHTGSSLDFPAKTVKAGTHGVPGGENMYYFDNGKVRYMSLAECAYIQGFPKEYKFYGGFKHMMRMIGNACPSGLVSAVVSVLLKSTIT